MIIQDIYEHYEIPPHLQLHMLRVAGICKLICDHRTGPALDRESLIQAALVHDLGNRVKMTVFPGVFEPTDVDAFLEKKEEMIEKYGRDDHIANINICKELGLQQNVIDLVDGVGFHKFTSYTLQDTELLMINYADLRTGPLGVIDTYTRLREAAMRYNNMERLASLEQSMQSVDAQESNILTYCSLSEKDISDESINPLIENLRKTNIDTSQ